jgi:hypothetical protein
MIVSNDAHYTMESAKSWKSNASIPSLNLSKKDSGKSTVIEDDKDITKLNDLLYKLTATEQQQQQQPTNENEKKINFKRFCDYFDDINFLHV